ncbi:DNA recombination protein RmuC, partial [Candidatus Pacearchaeota archaeon]
VGLQIVVSAAPGRRGRAARRLTPTLGNGGNALILTLGNIELIAIGIGLLLILVGAIIIFRVSKRANMQIARLREEINQQQASVAFLSQSIKDIGQHFGSGFSALHSSQQQLNTQIAKLVEGLIQVERALTSKIVDGDQRSNRELQSLREDTFKSITRLHEEILKVVQAFQQSSTSEIQSLREDTFKSFARLHEEILKVVQAFQQSSTSEIQALQRNLLTNIRQLHEQISILHTQASERKELERQTAESIKRLEAILAGTQSKGAAGERIVEQVFSKLPAEWQVRNFRINGRVVEFGLRLPNGLVLPIDSKWPSSDLVDKFARSEIPEEQIILKREIEKVVLRKAQEARKYVDPSQTLPFAVIVVPDAVFELSIGVHAESVRIGVAILSYSMFVPYLLLVFHTILKSSQSFDIQALATYLESVNKSLGQIQEEIEGRFSRALTMLNNSRDAVRAHLQQANASLIALEVNTDVKERQEM